MKITSAIKLEKIDDYRWRIPKTNGMRVPGIVYADEHLLQDIYRDKATQQVSNAAHLPGIVKYSLAMPDIHWGYGLPIGGVVATDIEAGGVITPGGVGYDVNCLCGDSFILNELGYKIKIKDYEKTFHKHNLTCMDFIEDKSQPTKIITFLKQKSNRPVLNIFTETGRQITATSDHPFYTENGMKELEKLLPGDKVAIYPFEGVRYEKPNSNIIIDEDLIKKFLLKLGKTSRGNAVEQILTQLKKKNILPLRYDSFQLPYLLKIMGYCFGDGLLYFTGKRKHGHVCFYGQKEDLNKIKEDLHKIGFKSSTYSRFRHHKIRTTYGLTEFEREETWLKVSSSGFAVLLAALGMPISNKCRQSYRIPSRLKKLPLWQKRLFLAGLFGAELSSPKTLTNHDYNFYCPILSMNKTKNHLDSGKEFLRDISNLLKEFGISTLKISQRESYTNNSGLTSYCLRLILSNQTTDLINLYSKVGFEYNEKRKFLGNIAAGYLKVKKKIINKKKEVAALAPALYSSGSWDKECLCNYLADFPYISNKFIERSLYEPRKTEPRMWGEDPTFEEYRIKATEGLGASGMVWEKIETISEIDYNDYVYDFSVAHPHHNFVADNFVVSNCGVRLLKTNLVEKEIRHKIKDLVYGLYNSVPAGVGSKGEIRVGIEEEKKLLVRGAEWAVSKGYGRKEDLDVTEERGAMKGADPSRVSERAYERGKRQSGTLGSGNHFLEIQVIDQIYDKEAAEVFDLAAGQIVVMIHSGSRGFGYQICDDYAKGMIKYLSKYNISVPDRQLACVPVNSEEGKAYLGAMRCAANYAWANRQCLMHLTRKVFEKVFNRSERDLGMDLIYDVAHNIAKFEKYNIDGKEKLLCVHRKGATRAFGPDHPDLPDKYKSIGQPVIIPGDMGRNSYLLVGTKKAEETFFSTCHGAGRVMSRTAAIKACSGRSISKELEKKGVVVMAAGRATLAEEAPEAYKDVNEVVHVVHEAGISKRVCRMRPLGVVKG